MTPHQVIAHGCQALKRNKVTPQKVLHAASVVTGYPYGEILLRNRRKGLSDARCLIMAACLDLCGLGPKEIATFFKRDVAAIYHAKRKANSPKFSKAYAELKSKTRKQLNGPLQRFELPKAKY